jgi:hypothetical protein
VCSRWSLSPSTRGSEHSAPRSSSASASRTDEEFPAVLVAVTMSRV